MVRLFAYRVSVSSSTGTSRSWAMKRRRLVDVGGLVALSAVDGRHHEGRLAFDQHPLHGDLLGGVLEVAGVAVGDVAGKRDPEVQVQGLLGVLVVLRVAVEDAAPAWAGVPGGSPGRRSPRHGCG